MGRYKLGPQGAYYDPNDSGPDQASADQIQQFQQTQQPVQPNTGYQPPTGGINPGGGNIRPVPLPPGTQLPPMPQIPMLGPFGNAGGIRPGESQFDYTNRTRQAAGLPLMTQDEYMQANQPGGVYYNSGITGGMNRGGIGQLPGQMGGLQSQGGGINDPRWTNGTWGGGTLSTIGGFLK